MLAGGAIRPPLPRGDWTFRGLARNDASAIASVVSGAVLLETTILPAAIFDLGRARRNLQILMVKPAGSARIFDGTGIITRCALCTRVVRDCEKFRIDLLVQFILNSRLNRWNKIVGHFMIHIFLGICGSKTTLILYYLSVSFAYGSCVWRKLS